MGKIFKLPSNLISAIFLSSHFHLGISFTFSARSRAFSNMQSAISPAVSSETALSCSVYYSLAMCNTHHPNVCCYMLHLTEILSYWQIYSFFNSIFVHVLWSLFLNGCVQVLNLYFSIRLYVSVNLLLLWQWEFPLIGINKILTLPTICWRSADGTIARLSSNNIHQAYSITISRGQIAKKSLFRSSSYSIHNSCL